MSKAKKRSTPLKAKSLSKAAKPAKLDCPVASIARQTIPLIELANGHQQLAEMATDPNSKARHEEQIRHIHDQMRGNRDAASFLIPRSLEGVAFLCAALTQMQSTWLTTTTSGIAKSTGAASAVPPMASGATSRAGTYTSTL